MNSQEFTSHYFCDKNKKGGPTSRSPPIQTRGSKSVPIDSL